MIDKSELLDPTKTGELSEREKKIVEDAQNAGISTESTEALTDETVSPGGITGQTVDEEALKKTAKPGGQSDISGGVANLDEITSAGVEQNEYNQ